MSDAEKELRELLPIHRDSPVLLYRYCALASQHAEVLLAEMDRLRGLLRKIWRHGDLDRETGNELDRMFMELPVDAPGE